MNRILSITAIAVILATPAFATIQSGATCDTTNLGQSENNSTANVEADWTANTIHIDWYANADDDTPYASTTCTYDDTITLPQTAPTKTGYTFNGWQLVEEAQALSCADYSNQQDCNNMMLCSWISENNTCVNLYDYVHAIQTETECTTKGFSWCEPQNRCEPTQMLCLLG